MPLNCVRENLTQRTCVEQTTLTKPTYSSVRIFVCVTLKVKNKIILNSGRFNSVSPGACKSSVVLLVSGEGQTQFS